jgi:hypothetical protein
MANPGRSWHNGPKGTFLAAALVFAAALGGYFVWTGRIFGGKPVCEICHRELHPNNVFVTLDTRGKRKVSCCPRCGLHHVINLGGRALEATDFSTGKPVAAESAIYLEGSDIMECCAPSGFREAQGGYGDIAYDRCMPSLIAFSKKEEAEAIRQKHDGQILTFEQAKWSVARQISGKQ